MVDMTIAGKTTIDYQNDLENNTVTMIQDQNKSSLDFKSNEFNAQGNVGFKRISKENEPAYFQYVTGKPGPMSIKVGAMEFSLPKTGIEFGFAQNPHNGGYETIYAANGGIEFDLIPNLLKININAGHSDYSSMQEAMEAVHKGEYFEKLRVSKVKDSSWNVGNIQGRANIGESTEIDLGIVKLDNIQIASHFPGEAKMPLGLFRYSGIRRDDKEGVPSSISVDVKDVYPNIGPFAEELGKLVGYIDKFTSITKEPLDKLKEGYFRKVYQTLQGGLEAAIKKGYDIWDDTIGWFYDDWKAKNVFGEIDTGIADALGSTFGNNIPQMIDKIYAAKNKTINLDKKITTFIDFSNIISDLSNAKKSEYSSGDKQSITKSSGTDSTTESAWPSLLSFNIGLGNSNDKTVTRNNTTDENAGGSETSSFNLGLPTLSGASDSGGSDNTSIQFPAISSAKSIGKLLANVFLHPEKENELLKISLGIKIPRTSEKYQVPRLPIPGLKPKGEIQTGIGLELNTVAGLSITGKELIELATTKTLEFDTVTGLLKNHGYWNLGETIAIIDPILQGNIGVVAISKDSIPNPFPSPPNNLGVLLKLPLEGGISLKPKNQDKIYLKDLNNLNFDLDWAGKSIILIPTISAEYLFGSENIQIARIPIFDFT
jgi:hypothetical protein